MLHRPTKTQTLFRNLLNAAVNVVAPKTKLRTRSLTRVIALLTIVIGFSAPTAYAEVDHDPPECNSFPQLTQSASGTPEVPDQYPPELRNVVVSDVDWHIDGTQTYFVTMNVYDDYFGVGEVEVMINGQGDQCADRRGYFAWRLSPQNSPWSDEESHDRVACTGAGGFGEKYGGTEGEPAGWGRDYVRLVGCQTQYLSDESLLVKLELLPRTNFGEFDENDVSLWARDTGSKATNWKNYETNFASSVFENVPPSQGYLDVSQHIWALDGTSERDIIVIASDTGSGVSDIRTLINLQGDNSANRRGYFAWSLRGYTWTDGDSTDRMLCTGGGFADKYAGSLGEPRGMGSDYITLVGCETEVDGNDRKVTFTVVPRTDFGEFDNNDISFWARDNEDNIADWQNNDLNFESRAAVAYTIDVVEWNGGPPFQISPAVVPHREPLTFRITNNDFDVLLVPCSGFGITEVVPSFDVSNILFNTCTDRVTVPAFGEALFGFDIDVGFVAQSGSYDLELFVEPSNGDWQTLYFPTFIEVPGAQNFGEIQLVSSSGTLISNGGIYEPPQQTFDGDELVFGLRNGNTENVAATNLQASVMMQPPNATITLDIDSLNEGCFFLPPPCQVMPNSLPGGDTQFGIILNVDGELAGEYVINANIDIVNSVTSDFLGTYSFEIRGTLGNNPPFNDPRPIIVARTGSILNPHSTVLLVLDDSDYITDIPSDVTVVKIESEEMLNFLREFESAPAIYELQIFNEVSGTDLTLSSLKILEGDVFKLCTTEMGFECNSVFTPPDGYLLPFEWDKVSDLPSNGLQIFLHFNDPMPDVPAGIGTYTTGINAITDSLVGYGFNVLGEVVMTDGDATDLVVTYLNAGDRFDVDIDSLLTLDTIPNIGDTAFAFELCNDSTSSPFSGQMLVDDTSMATEGGFDENVIFAFTLGVKGSPTECTNTTVAVQAGNNPDSNETYTAEVSIANADSEFPFSLSVDTADVGVKIEYVDGIFGNNGLADFSAILFEEVPFDVTFTFSDNQAFQTRDFRIDGLEGAVEFQLSGGFPNNTGPGGQFTLTGTATDGMDLRGIVSFEYEEPTGVWQDFLFEIYVPVSSIDVIAPDGSNIGNGGIVVEEIAVNELPLSLQLTLENNGENSIQLAVFDITGNYDLGDPPSEIPVGGSAALEVVLDGVGVGTQTGMLSFTSDGNPFEITIDTDVVNGPPEPDPDIVIGYGNNLNPVILTGNTHHLGNSEHDVNVDIPLGIRNDGEGDLLLVDLVSLFQNPGLEFSVLSSPARDTVIRPGETNTDTVIRFRADINDVDTTQSTEVWFQSNYPDEGSYVVLLEIYVVEPPPPPEPEIRVGNILNGELDFGIVEKLDLPVKRYVTVFNDGSETLTLNTYGITNDVRDAISFELPNPTTVPPGGNKSIGIVLSLPADGLGGLVTGNVTFSHNAPNEPSPFEFSVKALVINDIPGCEPNCPGVEPDN